MKWFTADWHLGHTNIIDHCRRPFNDAGEMGACIIKSMKDAVKPGDNLYILGDIAMRHHIAVRAITELRDSGIHHIHLILGNHDSHRAKDIEDFNCLCDSVSQIKDIRCGDMSVVLCHYPIMSWNKKCHGSKHLHGHCHGMMHDDLNRMDVGVDCTNFNPISEVAVFRYFKENRDELHRAHNHKAV